MGDDGKRVSLTLELELADGPIAGSLREGPAPPRPFLGWLQLISALEAARAAIKGGDRGDDGLDTVN
jgi:hypothetical protein